MGILYQGNKQILGGGAGSLTELGVIASAYELNYVDGVTSNIQTQLNDKASISDIEDIAFVGDEEALDATIPLNASTLGGKTEDMLSVAKAVDSDTLGGKTEDMLSVANASTLGGKAPEYYIQPRNLLDNSDFRNPVNQRGGSSWNTNSVYTIDRWLIASVFGSTSSASISANGLTFKEGIFQRHPISASKMLNKKLTLAIKVSDSSPFDAGALRVGTIQIGSTVTKMQSHAYKVNPDSGDYALVVRWIDDALDIMEFRVQCTTDITLEWAALYEGEYTAETLPPYVPKGYGAELAECMRYYQVINTRTVGIGYATTKFVVHHQLSIPMRANPTISLESCVFYNTNGWTYDELKDYGNGMSSETCRVSFYFNKSGASFISNGAYSIEPLKATLSADL